MDFLWLLFAYTFGLGTSLLSLPPLIGFLIAGFALNLIGVESNDTLTALSDLGITLMLFTIGLKLNVKDLLKKEVWAGTISHMVIIVGLCASVALMLGAISLPYFELLDFKSAALLAFAMSFSSTVCVIKILEESGEMASRHGKFCIGILVMQDVVAVIFLALATGKIPSLWAIGLISLFWSRPFLFVFLNRAGHGELLPLGGFFMALGGYHLFELVSLKGDLGALIFGVLLSTHPKASELTRSLLGFKDLFLIGFFLSIGLSALPDAGMLFTAGALALILPIKFFLFFFLFTRFKLRGRTAFLASRALSNYSEFGLIVAVLAVGAGWMTEEWLVILAIAVSVSFVVSSISYRTAHSVYAKWKTTIRQHETPTPLPEDILEQPTHAEMLVVGTGRVGRGAYNALYSMVGEKVWGMDSDARRVKQQKDAGLHVFCGDGEDADLWEKIDISAVQLVLLALPSVLDNRNVAEQLKLANYQGKIAAIARYEDERQALLEAGIDKVFNFFAEAGTGFAEDSLEMIGIEVDHKNIAKQANHSN